MHIQAAVVRRFGAPLIIESLSLDEPRTGEILVRLVACGVAQCDIAAIAGRSEMALPFVPGAEATGIVERVGAGVETPAPGDAVLVAWSACGVCPACVGGQPRACEAFAALNLSGRRDDGSTPLDSDDGDVLGFFHGQSAFATHLICRASDTLVVDGDTPLEVAAAFGGDFLTGAAGVLHLADPHAGDAIVVSGADIVGLAACMIAKARGFHSIVVAERDEARHALALECGATIAVPDAEGLAAVVRSLAPDGAVFALETTGSEAARNACLASLAAGGTCAAVDDGETGSASMSATRDVDALMLLPRVLGLYRDGALPVEKLLNFFPFELLNDALDATASQSVVKAVVRFSLGIFGDLDRANREGAATDETTGDPKSEPAPIDDVSDPAGVSEVTA